MVDRAYKVEHIEQLAHDIIKLVVFHRGTETFWQTFYKSLDDGKSTEWFQVEPRKRMIIEYVTK